MNQSRVLVIDDFPEICSLIEQILQQQGYAVDSATDLSKARRRIDTQEYDCILLDHKVGDEDGTCLLGEILGSDPSQSVIVMTAFGSIQQAVQTLKQGAFSYVAKPFDAQELFRQVEQGCERSGLKKENRRLKTLLVEKAGLENIVGNSAPLLKLFEQVRQVANVDSTVLVTGESGTGKELIARSIHDLSPRVKNRFGAINCGAIPANLLESELFGYKRGAFTDARSDRKGLFEACSHGSLFLDEIGELPIELQVKLLRVLQEKEVVPLGSDKPVAVDVRIIAATNKNLREEVRRGRFREDLFFRVNVIPLHVPALRERREDIPLLSHHFLRQHSRQFNKRIDPIPEDLMRRMIAYDWPGNVRELQNNIERAVVMTTDSKLRADHFFMETFTGAGARMLSGTSLAYSEAKEEFEKSYLDHLLEVAGGDIAEAARLAGDGANDVFRLVSKYHVRPPRK